MFVVSGNTGRGGGPLIGSKVIWDRASDGSVWSVLLNFWGKTSDPRWTRRPNGVKNHL